MTLAGKKHELGRWITDFALAFVLFWVVASTFGGHHSRAYAVSLPDLAKQAILPAPASSSAQAIFRSDRPETSGQIFHKAQTNPEHARLLLSLAVAALAAINLGFWRHLRRVYASPRRSVWRRG